MHADAACIHDRRVTHPCSCLAHHQALFRLDKLLYRGGPKHTREYHGPHDMNIYLFQPHIKPINKHSSEREKKKRNGYNVDQ